MSIDITNPTIVTNYLKFPYAVKPFNLTQKIAKVVMVAIHILFFLGLVILMKDSDEFKKIAAMYFEHMWDNKDIKSTDIIIDTYNDYELKMLFSKIRRLYEMQKGDQIYFECYDDRLILVTKKQFDTLDQQQREAVVTCLDKLSARDDLKADYAKEINVLKRISTEIFISLNPAQNGLKTLPNKVLEELILGHLTPKDIETTKQVSGHFKEVVATHHAKILSINNGRLNLKSALPPHIKNADDAIKWLEQDKVSARFLTYVDFQGFTDFNEQHLKKLTEISPRITHLIITSTELTVIEQLPSSLTEFTCFNKKPIKLPELPVSLTVFRCFRVVGGLPNLPDKLKELTCWGQTKLPKLPNSLEVLDCRHWGGTSLPSILPATLTKLNCSHSPKLTKLPPLHAGLKELTYVNCRALIESPGLPNSLEELYCCESTGQVKLPELPPLLRTLNYEDCKTLTELPVLPPTLTNLFCIKCPVLTKLPDLPPSLRTLVCNECPSLTDLPTLPDFLIVLNCKDTPMEERARETIVASKFLE